MTHLPRKNATGACSPAAGKRQPIDHPTADVHFCTAHLLPDLKKHTISSTFVTLIAQGVIFLLTMGSTMVMARLLTPREFGLVAMVMTVTGFLRALRFTGLSSATIQRETVTHAQVSNLFWLNTTLGALAGLLLVSLSPVVAWFYRDDRLIEISVVLSLTFVLEAAAVQHLALLNRQMRFTAIAVIQVVSSAVGITAGITLAAIGFGYWALVAAQVMTPLLALVLTWSASSWRPQLPRRASGTRSLVRFGASLTASSLVYSLAAGADSLLLGRFHGAAAVGLYTRAAALLRRPLDQFLAPINAVSIPVLARLQSQPDLYRRRFLQIHDAVALMTMIVSGLCFALAVPLTGVLLGPQWSEAAPLVASFSIAAIATPLAGTCSWLFESQGRGRGTLLTSLLSSAFTMASIICGLPYGATGVAIAYAGSALVIQLPLFYYQAGRQGPVRTRELWLALLKQAPVWPIVSSAAYLADRWTGADAPVLDRLLSGLMAGILAGTAFVAVYAPARLQAITLFTALKEWGRQRRAAETDALPTKQPI